MERDPVNFRAEWDAEANVWFVAESSYPGLVAEASTLDSLVKCVRAALNDLIEVNGEPAVAGGARFIMQADLPLAA